MSAQKKLDAKQYKTVDEFEADIQLMLDNCYMYNPQGDPVVQMAQEFECVVKNEMKKLDAVRAFDAEKVEMNVKNLMHHARPEKIKLRNQLMNMRRKSSTIKSCPPCLTMRPSSCPSCLHVQRKT